MNQATEVVENVEQISAVEWQNIWSQRCELLNWTGITYRYHRKRQRFFDVVDKLTQVAAVFGGVVFLGQTLSDLLPLVGAVISGTSLLALVYGYSDKRQAHKELAEAANKLAGEIKKTGSESLSQACIQQWEEQRCSIDMREPPNLKVLVSKCEWEQAVSEGHKDLLSAPGFWKQLHMHFF